MRAPVAMISRPSENWLARSWVVGCRAAVRFDSIARSSQSSLPMNGNAFAFSCYRMSIVVVNGSIQPAQETDCPFCRQLIHRSDFTPCSLRPGDQIYYTVCGATDGNHVATCVVQLGGNNEAGAVGRK